MSWLFSTLKVSSRLGKLQSRGTVPVKWLLPAEKAAKLPSLVSMGSVPFRALFPCSAHHRVRCRLGRCQALLGCLACR